MDTPACHFAGGGVPSAYPPCSVGRDPCVPPRDMRCLSPSRLRRQPPPRGGLAARRCRAGMRIATPVTRSLVRNDSASRCRGRRSLRPVPCHSEPVRRLAWESVPQSLPLRGRWQREALTEGEISHGTFSPPVGCADSPLPEGALQRGAAALTGRRGRRPLQSRTGAAQNGTAKRPPGTRKHTVLPVSIRLKSTKKAPTCVSMRAFLQPISARIYFGKTASHRKRARFVQSRGAPPQAYWMSVKAAQRRGCAKRAFCGVCFLMPGGLSRGSLL